MTLHNNPMLTKELLEAVNVLVTSVISYESDTFSAKEKEISWKEAEQVAAQLIYAKLFTPDSYENVLGGRIKDVYWHVDGADLEDALDIVREIK